jgi:stearoyl-CoA desaturase (delta-9 desaturase)
MNLHQKVKLTLLTTNILALIALLFFFSWWGFITSIGMFVVYSFGVSGGFHRLFAHRAFETNTFGKWFFLISGTLASVGSSISWVGQHRLHHAKADIKGEDPYYAHGNILGYWIFGPWAIANSPLIIKDLLRDPVHKWMHNNYFKIVIAWVVLLFLLNPVLVFWVWAIPSAATFFSLQIVGGLGHIVGYRDFETNDLSKNNHWLNLITLGESYQNTHHNDPRTLVMGRLDIIGWTIKYIFAK